MAVALSRCGVEKLSLYAQGGQLVQADLPLPDVGSIGGLAARKDDSDYFSYFSSCPSTPTSSIARATCRLVHSRSAGQQSVFREIAVSGFDARAFDRPRARRRLLPQAHPRSRLASIQAE